MAGSQACRHLHFIQLALLSFFCILSSGSAIADEPQVVFTDKTTELGLQLANSAACWADFDNDDWVDLCAAAVWKNEEGKRFTKVITVGSSVAADFDNDGFIDLFSWSNLRLFRNNGGDGFTEFDLPDLPKCVSRGACWGDFNGDSFVDLYVAGFEDWDANITWPSFALLNNGGKAFQFQQVENWCRSRGVTACDFDQDGDLDIYVSNYRPPAEPALAEQWGRRLQGRRPRSRCRRYLAPVHRRGIPSAPPGATSITMDESICSPATSPTWTTGAISQSPAS